MISPQKVLTLSNALKLKKPKLEGNYYITRKEDGWYTQIEYRKATGFWYAPISSRGRVIPSIAWTTRLFNKLPKPHEDCVLIGEVIVPDAPFHIANGLLNRSVGNYSCKDIVFKLHDIVFPSYPNSAETRWRYLQELDISRIDDYVHKVELIVISPYYKPLWEDIFNRVIDSGGEGIVAKREDSIYSPGKRNSDLLKLKLECTIDALASRVETTIGDKGNLGVTLISKRKNGVELRTVINSLDLQDTLIARPDEVIGKVVEIHGMEELLDGNIRQPTFYCIREDKEPSEID